MPMTHDQICRAISNGWPGKEYTVRGDTILQIEGVEDLPDEAALSAFDHPAVTDIKREAMRRILEKYPDWKQRNMATRGVELQDLWRQNGSWTSGQTSEDTALKAAWAWIDSARAASDTLESSLPKDYEDDSHWPS